MAIRRCSLLVCTARPFRTHPPYGKRFGEICPAKSPALPELLRDLNWFQTAATADVSKGVTSAKFVLFALCTLEGL
jgi:hypothetical protein